jgi:uncharacterized membrane protein
MADRSVRPTHKPAPSQGKRRLSLRVFAPIPDIMFASSNHQPLGWRISMMSLSQIAFSPLVSLPADFSTNLLMFLRWTHFVAGITWMGLLYFFNLVNVPFMKEIDTATKAKVIPALMPRALFWFRWSSVVTVIAGIAYWGSIVETDARNAGVHGGATMGSFFLIWTVTWGILYALLIPGKGILDKGPVLALLTAIIVVAASWVFLSLNDHGWESNRLLAIGIGGGLGWMMMLNVWGVIWRIQKRLIQWTKENAANGTPIPEKSKRMARMVFLTSRINAFLSLPLLFLMGAASHYPMFGR